MTGPRRAASAHPASHDHAVRLTNDERERAWANVRPRDAATLVLLDRSGAEPKVLMGRRHARHKFMPGKFVFPGGARDAEDADAPADGALHPTVLARLCARVVRPTERRARALAMAALRETFEETGLALGVRASVEGNGEGAGAVWARYAALGVRPSLGGLHFVARAITPPRRPRRFDARFFAADATLVAERAAGVVGPDAELTELVWIDLSKARTLDLPTITQIVLEELDLRLKAGFGHDVPVPFFFEQHKRWQRLEL